jgi:hypothetical protein
MDNVSFYIANRSRAHYGATASSPTAMDQAQAIFFLLAGWMPPCIGKIKMENFKAPFEVLKEVELILNFTFFLKLRN